MTVTVFFLALVDKRAASSSKFITGVYYVTVDDDTTRDELQKVKKEIIADLERSRIFG